MPQETPNFTDAAVFKHSTSGFTPASGSAAVYIKSDNKLYVKDSSGTEAAAGGGVTAVGASTDDVLSVSGSDLIADDGGTIDSSDPFIKWDDVAGKLVYANPLSRPSGSFYVGLAPTTTALGTNVVNIQSGRTAATKVASGDHSVAIGYTNQSSGALSVAIGYNTQSTNNGAVAIGWSQTASNIYATAIGGQTNQATQRNAVVIGGTTALADRNGARAFCSHSNSALGHRQELQFFISRTTTNNTPSEMYSDEYLAARITIPSGKVMGGIICVTGSKSDGSAVALYTRQFVIKNVGGTTTLLSSSTIGTDHEDNASTDITVEANDTNDALRVNVTGITGETWRWTGWVHCTEHYYGT